MPRKRRHIAVIGAGAGGLVAARECLRRGFAVDVFEKSEELGGVWVYRDETEDDPLGLNPSARLHASLYASLRTNLPKDLMAFRDFPFLGAGEEPQFIGHVEVRDYLERFADACSLQPHIRFKARVTRVESAGRGWWNVSVNDEPAQRFHAVIIANGHYSRPRIPKVPGMEQFRGTLLHSHNYRTPEPFRCQRVALFGAAASAVDLAMEIATVASEVVWCAEQHPDLELGEKIVRKPPPARFGEYGVILKNGETLDSVDSFIFCTGYQYSFRFLEEGIVNVEDNWVHPLYHELIPPDHPTLAFIGLPYAIIPFPLFEYQAQWFSRMLAGEFPLPSTGAMHRTCGEHETALRASGKKQRNFHKMGADQFAYMDRLAAECGEEPLPDWFEPLAQKVSEHRMESPTTYRDRPIYE